MCSVFEKSHRLCKRKPRVSLWLNYRVHNCSARREAEQASRQRCRRKYAPWIQGSDIGFVHVTPLPVAGFERLHNRMVRRAKMFCRMLARAGVATANMAAV